MKEKFPPCRHIRDKHVTADELLPMIKQLGRKSPLKWGDAESSLLLKQFSNVLTVDARRSSQVFTQSGCGLMSKVWP